MADQRSDRSFASMVEDKQRGNTSGKHASGGSLKSGPGRVADAGLKAESTDGAPWRGH